MAGTGYITRQSVKMYMAAAGENWVIVELSLIHIFAKELRQSQKEYEQAQTRIADIDKIIRKLYEDNVMGKIPEERFYKMSAEYEAEQKALEERITKLKHTIDTANEQSLNTDRFLALVKKYTEITELDAEIIREFIRCV